MSEDLGVEGRFGACEADTVVFDVGGEVECYCQWMIRCLKIILFPHFLLVVATYLTPRWST